MKAYKALMLAMAMVFLFTQAGLCVLAAPGYPTKLREAEWHRNAKGLFGKLKKSTGIGKKLRKCEIRYGAVEWHKLEGGRWVGDLFKSHKEEALQMAKEKSAENVEKVKALRKTVWSARKKAQDVYSEWKNLRSKTKKSKQYVRSIAIEAEEFYELLSRYLKPDESTIEEIYQEKRMAFYRRLSGKVDSDYKKMKKGLKEVITAGEEAHYLSYKVFLDPFRNFLATIRRVPELDEKWGLRVNALTNKIGSWDLSSPNLEGQDLVDACKEAMRMAKQARKDFKAFVN